MNRKHRFIYALFRPLVSVFLKLRFGYRYEKATDLPDRYIVLSNHTTDYDPLFVGVSFRQMYFVASEHISRWKHAYALLKFGFAPIMRRKGTVASTTVKEMMRHLKQGKNVCLFAEGARSWDGVTAPIHPSTAKMIQHAGCALVTYRIEGGYFVSPLWSVGKPRRGRIRGGVVNVYTHEQLAAMTVEEIHRAIEADLWEDAYARQAKDPAPYGKQKLAERLETLLFLCPHCAADDRFVSEGNTVRCDACGHTFTYDAYGMLHDAPFDTVKAFSDWQKEQVASHVQANACYKAPTATLARIVAHTEEPLDSGELTMDTHTLTCGETRFPMAEISDLAMHGRHAIVFSVNKVYYELIVQPDSNALRFMLYYDASRARVPVV